MKRLWLIAALMVWLTPATAQQKFSTLPTATTPAGSSDTTVGVQAGRDVQFPALSLSGFSVADDLVCVTTVASLVDCASVFNGTSQVLYHSYAPVVGSAYSIGTNANPVTTAGPFFKFSRTENIPVSQCFNSVDNECNATISVYSSATATSGMQNNAISAYAIGSQTVGSTLANQAIVAVGRVINSGVTTGNAAYLEGRADTSTGNFLGTEIRANNQTNASYTYNYNEFSSGGVWVTAQSANTANLVGHGVAVASGTPGSQFDVGYGVVLGSVANQSFRDDSGAVTSFQINGTHTYGIDMTGMTINSGGAPVLAPLTTPSSSSAICKQGSIEWDASFLYVCTSSNTWKRAALSTF